MKTEFMTEAKRKGRIVTFYSYKGGTGRSMALANVAWILASQGKRVLTLDWDLEAPGLHRYFHPFLVDKDLTASDGIIDFVCKFTTAASLPHSGKKNENNSSKAETSDLVEETEAEKEPDEEWYKPYTNILRYAASLDWKFKDQGTIDFIPAGRQGASYATRINSFDWRFFYEKLGGGRLFELAKERMCAEYDYILIDSRTGVSDTSGICTIQMPDVLVVCFTLNNQGIEGAAAVAQDVFEKRFKSAVTEQGNSINSANSPEAAEGIQIFPVPMRVENAEKKKLQARKDYAREKFKLFPNSFSEAARDIYWGDVPFIYVPYYAYEEILAAFGDKATDRISILAASEQLTSYITDGEVSRLEPPPEEKRKIILEQFEGKTLEVDSAAEENRFAETICSGLTREELKQMRQLMLRLIRLSQISEVGGDIPLRVNVDDLELTAGSILSFAIRAGLVQKETDELFDGEFVKIAPDSLINNWIRLREWIEENREFLLWRQKLQVKLQEWKDVNKDAGALLKGVPLEEAEKWLETRIDWLNDAELNYISLSTAESQHLFWKIKKEEEEKVYYQNTVVSLGNEKAYLENTILKSKRRSMIGAAVFIAISLIGVGLTIYVAFGSRPVEVNFKTEKSLELARLAQSANDPEVGLLLATQAARLEANEKTESALKEFLSKSRQQNVLQHPAAVYTAVYQPDSNLIATASNRKVYIWSEKDKIWTSVEIDTKQQQTRAIAFMPDNNPSMGLFATTGVDGNVHLSSVLKEGFVSSVYDPDKTMAEITSLSYSPQSKQLVVSTASNKVVLIDAYPKKTLNSQKLIGDVKSAKFSPDGKYIAAGGKSGEAVIFDADLNKEVFPRKKHQDEIQSVAFSPDSQFIVTAANDGTATIWSLGGTEPVIVITNNSIPLKDAEFSPDGRFILTAGVDGKGRVYEVSSGKLLFELLGHIGPINSAQFIRNGSSILTAGNDKTARLWDATVEIEVNGSIDELIAQSCTKVTRNLTQDEWILYIRDEPYQKTCGNLP